jgi:hypothetical protein
MAKKVRVFVQGMAPVVEPDTVPEAIENIEEQLKYLFEQYHFQLAVSGFKILIPQMDLVESSTGPIPGVASTRRE